MFATFDLFDIVRIMIVMLRIASNGFWNYSENCWKVWISEYLNISEMRKGRILKSAACFVLLYFLLDKRLPR